MNTNKFSSPQILTGSVSLTTGASQTVQLDANASRSNRWLRVEELSVSLYITGYSSVPADTSQLGSLVNIRPYAYNQALSKDYTPIWLLGPRLHAEAEFERNLVNQLASVSPFELYRWKFPKPFYLPPGTAFKTQLQRNGDARDIAMAGTVVGTVVLRCTQLSDAEAKEVAAKKVNPLPFITSWVPPWVADVANQTYKSNNLDLANPFLTDLFVQRMTARTRALPGTAAPRFGTQDYIGSEIRLTDTRNIICEWTNLVNIFPTTQAAWTFTRVLSPAEYITTELRTTLAASPNSYFPQVAIIGYRNEGLS